MFTTRYSYYINPNTKQFCQTAEGHAPITELPNFYFGDRPKFTLSFPADTIAEGDTLIAVLDNENRFLDTKQATGLNPVMAGVLHEVTSEEADSQSIEIQLFDYSKKFADVINGHDNAVTCLFTVYLKSTDGEGNFTFVELGQTIANGEPTVTSPECIWDDLPVTKYYTREELDAVYNQFLAGVSLVVEYSNLAKSYAVGGTGTREGENTDNAKYYAEMASQAANAVSTMYESIQRLANQVANTKEYIDGLVESIAIDIRDISAIAASVTDKAAQVSRDAQSVRQAKSSIDASVLFVTNAKSTVENLATQVSQNAVNVANDKDAVAQLAVQVSNAASQVSRDKADAKGYAESASSSLSNVQTIQTDVTQKQTAVTTMKNTIQVWYNQISSWYNSIQTFAEQMQGWWTDVDTWQQQVSTDKDAAETARDEAVTAKNAAVTAKTAAETAQTKAETAQSKAETAQTKAEEAQTGAEDARDEAIAALSSKRDILQTLVTSSSTALEVEAGKSYNWTVSAASTIALAAADKVAGKETRIDIYIDLQSGGSVSGSGVVISDAVLQSGWYKLIWDGTNATLYSTKAGGAASVITIPAATTSYTLQDNKHYQQVPDAVPTYTLPSATMDGLVHEITVLVDFLHVTSCSFVDAGGVPVTLQSAISPQIGEAYIFRCYWYGKWRVVPLKIRNAATASSSNGVVEVSDAVAGDALSLKMTAPRSVVVNQMINVGAITAGMNINGSFVSGLTNTDNVLKITRGAFSDSIYYNNTFVEVNTNDKLLLKSTVRLASQEGLTTKIMYVRLQQYSGSVKQEVTPVIPAFDSDYTYEHIFTMQNAGKYCLCIQQFGNAGAYSNMDFRVWNIQLVNLTQYFNGDQTLINSITSWDDLVAYDSRFASYVAYNTGTVAGVQPTVKVSGKNLANPQLLVDAGGVLQDDGSYYWAIASTANKKVIFRNTTHYSGQFAIRYNTKYAETASVSGVICKIVYTDGTEFVVGSGTSEAAFGVYKERYSVTSANKIVDHLELTYGTGGTSTWFKDFQIELGSSATSYEPYHDGGTAQAPEELFAVGNAADEFEAVAGVTTHKMASVDLGTLAWTWVSNSDYGYWQSSAIAAYVAIPSSGAVTPNIISSNYACTYRNNLSGATAKIGLLAIGSAGAISVNTGSTTVSPTGILYYELATPTTSQSTPTQISLQAGSNVAMQTDGGRTLAELALTYENLPSEG